MTHSTQRTILRPLRLILLSLVLITSAGQVFGHGTASRPPADEARMISFPDTAQYKTLVFDPHTHSVFSDGHVWPRIRVGEALRDGLDAMAITEHLEYQPHLKDIPHTDRNRAYQDAVDAAKNSDLLVVPGAEITRSLPASHMNAVFISDANKLYWVPESETPYEPKEYRELANQWPPQNAVDAANEQGAFVFWNHSWWSSDFPNGIPTVSEFHQNNARNGLLHGIEIANGKHYSEDAFQIALDYKLTLIGCSDVHNLIDWDYEPHKGGHRPVTLVLAEERSLQSMKEALFDRRTVVWYKNWLIGRQAELTALMESCLGIEKATYGSGEILNVTFENRSDVDFQLRNLSPYGFHDMADTLTIPQHSTHTFMLRTPTRVNEVSLEFEVLNAFEAPRKTTRLTLMALVD